MPGRAKEAVERGPSDEGLEEDRHDQAAAVRPRPVSVAEGFKFDLIYSVPGKPRARGWPCASTRRAGYRRGPERQALSADRRFRAAATRSSPRRSGSRLGGAHGLLCAFDSLYVMVNEQGTHGLYRVRDTDGDDRYDAVKLLREIDGGGEHGLHSMVLSPDGKSLYVVCGNSTELTKLDSSRPAQLGRG